MFTISEYISVKISLIHWVLAKISANYTLVVFDCPWLYPRVTCDHHYSGLTVCMQLEIFFWQQRLSIYTAAPELLRVLFIGLILMQSGLPKKSNAWLSGISLDGTWPQVGFCVASLRSIVFLCTRLWPPTVPNLIESQANYMAFGHHRLPLSGRNNSDRAPLQHYK